MPKTMVFTVLWRGSPKTTRDKGNVPRGDTAETTLVSPMPRLLSEDGNRCVLE